MQESMTGKHLKLKVDFEWTGSRLDVFIPGKIPDLSRSFARKLIDDGMVMVNGNIKKASYNVAVNDIVSLTIPEPKICEAIPQNIPVNIIYEDDDIAVVEKPAGMVVHPSPGHFSDTLVNALLYHLGKMSAISGTLRPGIVHRLDRDVSGIVVVAKNDRAHASLSDQFKSRTASKIYLALLWGLLKEDEGRIDKPIGRHRSDRKKMTVTSERGKDAVTDYTVVDRCGPFTFAKIKILTGRTHQIRVHMSSMGHAIIGDEVYGGQRWKSMSQGEVRNRIMKMQRLALHAWKLGIAHPLSREWMEFECPLPPEIENLISLIRSESA